MGSLTEEKFIQLCRALNLHPQMVDDADAFEAALDALGKLRRIRHAAQRVFDGLNARIDSERPTPIFDGIAELASALAAESTSHG